MSNTTTPLPFTINFHIGGACLTFTESDDITAKLVELYALKTSVTPEQISNILDKMMTAQTASQAGGPKNH